jgi:hypothetical protein
MATPQKPVLDKTKEFMRMSRRPEDQLSRTQTFIKGKMDLVRHDTSLTKAEKAAAIADLRAQLRRS